LDLYQAPEVFEKSYGKKRSRKNLHNYFVKTVLPNIQVPSRRYFTTNDPVMTPDLLDYFFNQRTQVFANLDTRRKSLLHAIYELEPYQRVLPPVPVNLNNQEILRQHTRYSVKCPGTLCVQETSVEETYSVMVTDLSEFGFKAQSSMPLPINTWCDASIQLGKSELSMLKVMVVRRSEQGTDCVYGFKLAEPDLPWRKFVNAMSQGTTYDDLEYATRFLPT
jgi:hypothetical protein